VNSLQDSVSVTVYFAFFSSLSDIASNADNTPFTVFKYHSSIDTTVHITVYFASSNSLFLSFFFHQRIRSRSHKLKINHHKPAITTNSEKLSLIFHLLNAAHINNHHIKNRTYDTNLIAGLLFT
jgi:hypothetical protein